MVSLEVDFCFIYREILTISPRVRSTLIREFRENDLHFIITCFRFVLL